jgi:hypothetical protein
MGMAQVPKIRIKALRTLAPKPASFKGVHTSSGYHGKQTQARVAKRTANPNKPMAPAPRPATTTLSKHKAAGGTNASWAAHVKSVKPNTAHTEALKNDPAHHLQTAIAMNHERSTRRMESKVDHPMPTPKLQAPAKRLAKKVSPTPPMRTRARKTISKPPYEGRHRRNG